MAKSIAVPLLLCSLISFFVASSAQSCKSYTFSSNNVFSSCFDLPVLSSYLYWNSNSSTGLVQIAYRATGVSSSNWVAWAINPTNTGMVGAQALVAYQQADSTIKAYTSPVKSYSTTLTEGNLSFNVSDLSATFANNEMIIFATLALTTSSVNQVWQVGPLSGGSPSQHSQGGANIQSTGTINLSSGQSGGSGSSSAGGGGSGGAAKSKLRRKNIHGILNAVSWGIMMPIGVLFARYLKMSKAADPAWFYLHIGCQASAYVVGVAGWATGLKLGSESPGLDYDVHRNIGITLFCLGTLQIFALLLRPNKDHKFRFYWNIYHHGVGYGVIILSIINIFKGLDILAPGKNWKRGYTGFIVILALIYICLETLTWFIILKKRKVDGKTGTNGTNGYNGDGTRQQTTDA